MIYFDNDKNAYGFEIPNYIATTTDENWANFAGTDKWDIIDGVFTDISETEDYKNIQAEKLKQQKITEIKKQLEDIDLKSVRALRSNEDERLVELENQAVELREKLNNL